METFTRWVYYFLESLGLDLSYMTNLNRLIVLVLIAVLAFLTDWICRKGIVRLVRKVTQKTKVTWDDLLFNDRVMNNFCHILPPVVVYILLPIAFPDGSDALAFIRKLCMVYIIAAALRVINIKIAAEAPKPAKRWIGDFSINTAIMQIEPTKNKAT